MSPAGGPERLFATLLGREPSRPFVTYYDDASGERIELSAKSLANWVAKTHFLLSDELGLGPGDSALVALPADWITVAILLGCWSAGLQVISTSDAPAAAFVAPGTLGRADNAADIFVVNPASMTRSHAPGEVPSGASDYVAAVRPQADNWATVHFPAGPADLAVAGMTRAEVGTAVQARATQLGLGPGARVLFDRSWAGPDDWIDALLAPMSVLGSVVLVANADAGRRRRRIEQEHVTIAL